MEYHIAIRFRQVDELLIKFNQTDLVKDYICLFHSNYQRELPHLRDYGVYSVQRMRELADQCSKILGWNWTKNCYDDAAVTTIMHKDIEKYLSQEFSSIPSEHDALLHELHMCLHSMQNNNKRSVIQLEWFNDDGFDLQGYDFEFIHDNTLGSVCLQNPYVGHPPDWLWGQDDHTNVWQTCRFHDRVKPGLAINMQGSLDRCTVSFDQQKYVNWWSRVAPDFLAYNGHEKMLENTGRPVIGYVINNAVLLDLNKQTNIHFESVRFHPDLEIIPARQKFPIRCQIEKYDYENIAGPDWPSYDKFKSGINLPVFIIDEIYQMTGILVKN